MEIVVYDTGGIYVVDSSALYDPFPKKEENKNGQKSG